MKVSTTNIANAKISISLFYGCIKEQLKLTIVKNASI